MSDCQCESENSSGLLIGLILGLVLGAIIAIIIYKKDKGKTFDLLSKKLDNLMKPIPSKKEVTLPPKIISETVSLPVKKTKAKLFKKPRA
ncbi:MAG: hypothetical protein NTY75_04380 [Candidatus Shapirobacteria bacterium]|nr:hypothetical protein [Candidatus Shapirobacteria bacterium]